MKIKYLAFAFGLAASCAAPFKYYGKPFSVEDDEGSPKRYSTVWYKNCECKTVEESLKSAEGVFFNFDIKCKNKNRSERLDLMLSSFTHSNLSDKIGMRFSNYCE